MSLDQPLDSYETDNHYLVAFLMFSGVLYAAMEYRPGRDGKSYTYFLFERTEDLERLLFAYTRRSGTAGVIHAYLDHLKTIKNTLRANRSVVQP